jgi:ACS family tartrate transporter-like MFS transporter
MPAPSTPALDLEARTLRQISRRFIPLLMIAYVVSYLDRVNVGFAALTANHDLGLTPVMYGWGAGIFFLGYFVAEFPSNLILERVGARMWIARIMLTWGIFAACMALITGPLSFYTMRFLLGVAEAGFFPGVLLFLTYWFPIRYRARYIGIFMIGIPLSSLIGAPVSGMLLGLDGLLGLQGWKWLYIIEAMPAILIGVLVWFILTDRPAKATWLDAEQRAWLAAELAKEATPNRAHAKLGFLASMVNPRVLFYSAVFFNVSAGSYGLGLWLPQLVKNFGLTNLMTGFVTAIPFAFGTVGLIWFGWHSDQRKERVWHTAACAFIAACGLAAVVLTESPWLQMAAICVAAVGIFGIKGPFLALITEMFTGAGAAGGIAMVSSIGNLSGFLPPYIVGWIKALTGSFSLGLLFLAFLALVAAIQMVVAVRFRRFRGFVETA